MLSFAKISRVTVPPGRVSGRQSLSKASRRLRPGRWLGALALVFAVAHLEAKPYSFPETRSVGAEELPRRGEATFRWYFVTLYDAALFLPAGIPAEEALGEIPRHLEIAYHRSIPVGKIVEAGNRLLAKNTPPEVLEELEPALATINAAYVTPQKGDRYTLTYVPGEGTTLSLNDDPLAVIPGDRFAAYYFRIWLGEQPVDPRLRDSLLGLQ